MRLQVTSRAVKNPAYQSHHITPIYLGGAPKGPTVPLLKGDHLKVTNEFRRWYGYGQPVPDPGRVQYFRQKVYEKYPLPPGAGQ